MEDETLKMIPTGHRTKIPRALSYVTAAQMISQAWQDVPQFEHLRIWFSCDVTKSLRPKNEPRLIFEVSYFRMKDSHFVSTRFNEPRWSVTVGVCLREDSHEVREWLRETGLSQSRAWLFKVAPLHGEYRALGWRAYFDEDSRLFSIKSNE